MEKTGELASGVSRCDHCGAYAAVVVESRALCSNCSASDFSKNAESDKITLKSFTDSLETA